MILGLCTTDFIFVKGLCFIFSAACSFLNLVSGSEHFLTVTSFFALLNPLFVFLFEIGGDLEWTNIIESTLDPDYVSNLIINEFNPILENRIQMFDISNLEEFDVSLFERIKILRKKLWL